MILNCFALICPLTCWCHEYCCHRSWSFSRQNLHGNNCFINIRTIFARGMVGPTHPLTPPSAAQGSVQAPPSTATWTRHFPPTLFPTLPSLRSSSSTLSTIICFVCDLLFKRQKSTQHTLPSHFVSFTCFLDTPSTAQSLPKSTPPWSNNTQIRQEYLTDLSFFPSRSHLIKSSITIIHHLTEYWPNWP